MITLRTFQPNIALWIQLEYLDKHVAAMIKSETKCTPKEKNAQSEKWKKEKVKQHKE